MVAAITLLAGTAQAATIYDKEGTKPDFYGRFYLYFENAADFEFGGEDSCLGIRASTKVNETPSVLPMPNFATTSD